jgi:hypothetical protein
MTFSARFFRFGAVCAFLTVLTTLGVHVLPDLWGDATSFAQQVDLRLNPFYLANRWTVLVHCALVVVSMFALGAAVRRESALAIIGFLAFVCFGFTEILRTGLSIFAVNRTWRAGYANAVDQATRDRIRSLIEAYNGVNNALFFIFYAAFTIGLLCYAIALLRLNGRMRWLGIVFAFWSLVNLPGLIDAITGHESLGRCFAWVGPYFQPLARAYVGVWLWKNAALLAVPVASEG